VSIEASPHARFQRSLQTRKLSVVLTAAAELQAIQLDDALEIMILIAAENDPRFDRAAARWVGRLLAGPLERQKWGAVSWPAPVLPLHELPPTGSTRGGA
jgi:hypothetical protein